MALSDILKKYGDTTATEGIMIPTAGVKSISTEQEVYDAATDGIMTVNQEKYIGPTSTIVYGNEDDSYTRMLREIEQGELPQFDQSTFPAVGTGIMQPSTPVTQPVDTTPVQPDEPKFDPCPPGFKLINGVCQPVEQDRGRDRPPPQGPKIVNGIIEGFTDLNDIAPGMAATDYYNRLSPEMKAEYDKAASYGRGVQVKLDDKGNPIRIVAHSPTLSELVGDAARAIGDIIENASLVNVVSKVLGSDEKPETKPEPEEGSTIVTRTGEGPIQIPTLTTEDFGGIDNISKTVRDFGIILNDVSSLLVESKSLQDRLKGLQNAGPKSNSKEDKDSYKTAENNLKRQIAINEKNRNIMIAQDKQKEKEVQQELNNSSESDFNVRGTTFTAHRNSDNKIIGYSNKGSNVVNMAGMQPIGPGQRIKKSTPTNTVRPGF